MWSTQAPLYDGPNSGTKKSVIKSKDSGQSKSMIDSIFESLRSSNNGSRKYRNKKHLKREIEPQKTRRLLNVNIRFPVVKFLRTDEDTYATLICELEDTRPDSINSNSVAQGHYVSSERSDDGDDNGDDDDDDEDWDTSDKRYTIRVRPPPDFLSRMTTPLTPSTTTTTTTTMATTTTMHELASNSTGADQVIEDSVGISSFSRRRLADVDAKEAANSTEDYQNVRTSVDDSIIAETTTIASIYQTNSSQKFTFGPFLGGNGSDLVVMKKPEVTDLQEAASSPVEIKSSYLSRKSSTGNIERSSNRSQNPVELEATDTLARMNSLERTGTNYLTNFIVSTISSLLILTLMFAILVIDTCADVRIHPSGDDIC